MSWQVGDVALYVGLDVPPLFKEEVEILALSPDDKLPADCDVAIYAPKLLSIHSSGGWAAHQKDLRPLSDPDGPGAWDECIWKPTVLERVE